MKLFCLFLGLTQAKFCDINCMSECWDLYQSESDQSFEQFNCLVTECGCSEYVSKSMSEFIDKI